VPADGLPQRPDRLFRRFAPAVTRTFAGIGIAAVYRPPGDIAHGERKLGAIAGGAIGEAMVVIGSFLFGFDYEAMAGALPAPPDGDRRRLKAGLEASLVTIERLLPVAPEPAEVKRRFIAEAAAVLGAHPAPSAISLREETRIARAAAALAILPRSAGADCPVFGRTRTRD
jgi:lipoate-protein ligase A